jgi:hypothetical protein
VTRSRCIISDVAFVHIMVDVCIYGEYTTWPMSFSWYTISCSVVSLHFLFSNIMILDKCQLNHVALHVVCHTSLHDFVASSLLDWFE